MRWFWLQNADINNLLRHFIQLQLEKAVILCSDTEPPRTAPKGCFAHFHLSSSVVIPIHKQVGPSAVADKVCIWIQDSTRLTTEEVNLGPGHYRFPGFGSGLYKFPKPWSSLLPSVVSSPCELSALERTHTQVPLVPDASAGRTSPTFTAISVSAELQHILFACVPYYLYQVGTYPLFLPSFLPTLGWIFKDESLIKRYFWKEHEKKTQTDLLYKEHRPCFLTGPIWNWFLLNRWSNRYHHRMVSNPSESVLRKGNIA